MYQDEMRAVPARVRSGRKAARRLLAAGHGGEARRADRQVRRLAGELKAAQGRARRVQRAIARGEW